MEDVKGQLAGKIQELGDLELAALTCLVAREQCIVYATPDRMSAVAEELLEIAVNTFGLSCAVLDCSPQTSTDDFSSALLVADEDYDNSILPRWRDNQPKSELHETGHQRIADVVVAANLSITHPHVQIQALELIRGKRIFTRTAVHAAPKRFLLIALLPTSDGPRLIPQLNDHMFVSHKHSSPNDSDEESAQLSISDNASESSIIRSTPMAPDVAIPSSRIADSNRRHTITKSDVDLLIAQTATVRLDSEVRSYIHNIAIFLRTHRAVAGGVSALSTRHFLSLSHALAPLHGLSYVSPSLVALAARKVYPHRIVLARPENERSMMWGSDVRAVRALLEGLTVEDVIEDVLGNVEMPL